MVVLESLTATLRPLAWRGGRRLFAWARHDGRNSPEINGEYWLLRQVLARSPGPATLLDVGANLGNWSMTALEERGPTGDIRVHAFEPSSRIRALLEERLQGYAGASVHPYALSDRNGSATFYAGERISGTGSLAPISGSQAEEVELMTLDTFAAREGIRHITMVKVDVEGFDSFVIEGARALLEQERIDVLQFEYNWRWLPNRRSLWDVFHHLLPPAYRLGKVVSGAVHGYPHWHPELDRFFEANYVLIRRGTPFEALITPYVFDVTNVARRAGRNGGR